jgi:2-hydroxy-4-carboxymuconate semialdehyde hemiacetal dehydrogenase
MNVALVGPGAIGIRHVEAIRNIDGLDVSCVVGGTEAEAEAFAREWDIPHWTADLDACLKTPELAAAIIATPTPMHAEQSIRCMRAGKHVLIEIPFAASLADAERVVRAQEEFGVIAMAAQTNRFRPGHRWLRERFESGTLHLLQLSVSTHFLRRSNVSVTGGDRAWTDHLLWHHACHAVDMFAFQTNSPVRRIAAIAGPIDERLGIALDLAIMLQASDGALCTVSLSFNNEGPQGSTFRYICDGGTFITRLDHLSDGFGNAIAERSIRVVPGVEAQDRDFYVACSTGGRPISDLRSVMPAMRTLDQIEHLACESQRTISLQ